MSETAPTYGDALAASTSSLLGVIFPAPVESEEA